MIEVKVYNNGFTITGHAGYDVMGKDIVCAAVSALSQTCVISLEILIGQSWVWTFLCS